MHSVHSTIILTRQDECYETIITIQPKPKGPLSTHIRQVRSRELSQFQHANKTNCVSCNYNSCVYAIINPVTHNPFCIDQMADCVELLLSNGYTIDYKLTKLLDKHSSNISESKLLFYITNKN